MTDRPDEQRVAPRIDTFRNLLDHVQQLLAELRPDIDDIHDLAYNRNRAAANARVSGGGRDYALDTHGDIQARDLYTEIGGELVGFGRLLERSIRQLRSHLNRQDTALRRDDSAAVSAAEHASALFSRGRRLERGERHPHVVVAQPTRKQHVDPNVELEHLQQAVRRLAHAFDGTTYLHTGCWDPEIGRRKPKPRWADRSILSPAQRSALDRALIGDEQRTAP